MMSDSITSSNVELFSIAKICGETLSNLIGNILDISKIENNKLQLIYKSENLRDSIERAVSMCKTIATQKGIYLKIIWDPNIPVYFQYDHPRLTQVLMNILSNSIKFTDKGGVILKVDWYPHLISDSPYLTLGPLHPTFQNIINHSQMDLYICNIYIYILVHQEDDYFPEPLDTSKISIEKVNVCPNTTENILIMKELNPDKNTSEKGCGYIKVQIIDTGN